MAGTSVAGMQYLGSEIGQLGGFVEAHARHAASIRTESWIGGHDAVHVGPDLDPLGVQAGADDRGAEIGAAATQRGGNAVSRRADKSAHDRESAPPSSSGTSTACRRWLVSSQSGVARVCAASVMMHSLASTSTASTPADRRAACTSLEERASPTPRRLSWACGRKCLLRSDARSAPCPEPRIPARTRRNRRVQIVATAPVRGRPFHAAGEAAAESPERNRGGCSAAAQPAFINWSVTLASALTTTTGRWGDARCTSWHTRRMAAASCTEVPPNFMTTHSPDCFPAALPIVRSSCLPFGFVVLWSLVTVMRTNKKPTGQLLLAVGLVSC